MDRLGLAIGRAARAGVRLQGAHLDGRARRVARATRIIRDATGALLAREARVLAHDPARRFARGWSVTTTQEGVPVTSVSTIPAGSRIVTRLSDGTVESTVDRVLPGDRGGAK